MTDPPALTRRWRPDFPVSPAFALLPLRHGRGDPTHHLDRVTGTAWRATRTPSGPALLVLVRRPDLGEIEATAWGPGGGWVLDGVPDLLGAADDPTGFEPLPEHPRLHDAWRRFGAFRVNRSRAVFESLAPVVMEQVVTGKEAKASWRRIVRRYGEAAPGPDGHGMLLPPTPQVWRTIPSWEWLQAGVEQRRSRTIVNSAARATALERTLDCPLPEADVRMRSLPGIGVWTSAEVRQRAHGDADAFSFFDYHVARSVSYALTGEETDDAGCAEIIRPYEGHRYRVQRLIELAGIGHPRFGPRMTLPTHVPAAGRRD